jgi:hypothetical protein
MLRGSRLITQAHVDGRTDKQNDFIMPSRGMLLHTPFHPQFAVKQKRKTVSLLVRLFPDKHGTMILHSQSRWHNRPEEFNLKKQFR